MNVVMEITTPLNSTMDREKSSDRGLTPVKGKILVAETSPEAIRRIRSIFGQFDVIILNQIDDFSIKSALLEHPDCSLLMIQKNLMVYHRPAVLNVMELLISLSIPVFFHEKSDIAFGDRILEKAIKAMGLWG